MTTRIAIRCTGHAVGGKLKQPRIGYATGGGESGWHLDGSASGDDTRAAKRFRAEHADASGLRTPGEPLKLERDRLRCTRCSDAVVMANPRRRSATFDTFLTEGRHTVYLDELRERYEAMSDDHPAVIQRAAIRDIPWVPVPGDPRYPAGDNARPAGAS